VENNIFLAIIKCRVESSRKLGVMNLAQSSIERTISKTWEVQPRLGSGSHLKVGQVIAPGNWKETDPFLMLAEDWFQRGTFEDPLPG
jgi:hypothetical protein